MSHLYVYGLALTSECSPTGIAGLSAAPVSLQQSDDLAVLVSPLAAPQVTRTRRNLLAHTGVLEEAHRCFNILPFRFGTVAPDAYTLVGCINANRQRFHEALREIAGRVELGVKASWKDGQMFASLAERDAKIRALNTRVRGRSEIETYYDRIELGRHVETGLAALRASETSRLTSDLAKIAERVASLPIQEDAVIFNEAYMVCRTREAEFDAAMEHLAVCCAGRIDLRYVGPMPPFNFVSMHAGWLNAGAGRAA